MRLTVDFVKLRQGVDLLRSKTYLTGMNAQTKVSAKGQVVIPKDVRERLDWPQGSQLEVIETAGGVLLRKPQGRTKLSFEEATARLRKVVNYTGPPLTIEQLSWSAEADRAYRRSKLSNK